MQEIKLIILIILTLCTYAKYRKLLNNNRSDKQKDIQDQSAPQDQVVVKIEEPQPEQKEAQNNGKVFLLAEDAIKKFIQVESSVITKFKAKLLNRHRFGMIKNCTDLNDILGGQYQKCKEGKIYEMESDALHYNISTLKKQSPFSRSSSLNQGQFTSNQVLFENIRNIIQNQRLYIDEPINTVNPAQVQRPNEISVFQNFTFNLPNNHQEFKMVQEMNGQQSQHQSNFGVKKKLKKKRILKSSKKHIKPVGYRQTTLGNVQKKVNKLKQKLVRPSKSIKLTNKKCINLKEKIKQKQLQLCILRKLYQEHDF